MSESGPSKKRKKLSGGLELWMALQALRTVRASLKEMPASDNPESQSELFALGPEFEETLDKMVDMMQSKADGPQALAFSGVKYEHLKQLNIRSGGRLRLKSDFKERADAIDALGAANHWSSDRLYSHLEILQDFVPNTNEVAARTWIDAFFFRSVPATPVIPFNLDTLGGFIDYTAVKVNGSEAHASAFLMNPALDSLTEHNHTLFVLEAKARDMALRDHIPQAVCEMYACAKSLGKNFIRGALTDGQTWIFIGPRIIPSEAVSKILKFRNFCLDTFWPFLSGLRMA
ncbi:hypothetical protein LshimejAT787_0200840 [Lyophyllum shimeji]|uniref:Uncharacterized protein n=1 Tax=Lyophyllum shimeji TaxID=47721 RepID=A0A9P3PFE8_LYOSH|nr:hypothetical protein LshimejAT787_0200840 [Lyophyllum shimeji]